ncbi:MAG TPA: class A beta-lactamase [Pseudomonadales bacterium]|nr:class A beta-lactamase [Pseudomonadales bacterium]
MQILGDKIEFLTKKLVGRIGVAAQEISTDRVISINADETFPMASTFKIATAVALLELVDQGKLSLDLYVEITPDMMVAGPNPIVQNFIHPGVKLSVANLIEVMITESDNTAAEVCLELAGGPVAVTQMLKRIGISKQSIDRYGTELLQDFYALPNKGYAAAVIEAMVKDPSLAAKIPNMNPTFERDSRDQTSPNAMLDLLLAIDGGEVLTDTSRAFLLTAMTHTRTGNSRLKGLLPKGTPVAHKTGTLGGIANDVGFITLPDGRRYAIAVYTKGSTTREADRERAIAEVSRAIFDYYYLNQ